MQEQNLQKPNGTVQISNEELKITIIHLINAMRMDYRKQFTRDFSTRVGDERQYAIDFNRKKETGVVVNQQLLMYKCRLYEKLKNKNVEDVFAGYDLWIDEKNKFYPSIPDLLGVIDRIEIERKKIKKQEVEIERINSLPAPKKTTQGNPLALLSKAKEKAMNELGSGKTDWMERKKLAELALNKETAVVPKNYSDSFHECCYNGCKRPGSISKSTSGSETWYCKTHIILG